MKADISYFKAFGIMVQVFQRFALITEGECCQSPKEIVKCSL